MTQDRSNDPVRRSLRSALWLAGLFSGITFLIHLLTSLWGAHLGYGFYRDEFYYLDCGRRLAWGFVDHPPLVALQARLAELLFGVSPTGVRIFSFMGGGVIVGLTGLLAWQFGADRRTQILAMSALMATPLFLGVTNFLSMNSIEPCFWMGALFFVLRIAEGTAGPNAWLWFGILTGLGIENKHSTVFFLIALTVGLLLTPQRRILFTRQCAVAVAVILLIASPNLLWQIHNHFPTYQFLERVRQSDKNVRLSVPLFLYDQVKVLLYSTFPLWFGGLLWLAFSAKARRWRFVAITYVVFVTIMIVLGGKYYYLGPIYPVLFAAGAVAFAQLVPRPRWINAYAAVLFLTTFFATGPITLTVLPPDRYNALTGIFSPSTRSVWRNSPAPCRKSSPTASAGLRWCRALPPATKPCPPTCAPRPPSSVTTTAKPAQSISSARNTVFRSHRRPSELLLLGLARFHRRLRPHPRRQPRPVHRRLRRSHRPWRLQLPLDHGLRAPPLLLASPP